MAETSANLVEGVLPPGVPLRQWVVTFPFELRHRFAFDAELLSAVCGLVHDVLLGFYARTLRERAGTWDGEGRRKLQSGTVMVVQRVNSDFRLNPHLHVLCLDGVFAEELEGPPTFVQLPSLTTAQVAEVLVTLCVRLLRLLERRGVIERADVTEGFTLLPSDATDPEPRPGSALGSRGHRYGPRRSRAPTAPTAPSRARRRAACPRSPLRIRQRPVATCRHHRQARRRRRQGGALPLSAPPAPRAGPRAAARRRHGAHRADAALRRWYHRGRSRSPLPPLPAGRVRARAEVQHGRYGGVLAPAAKWRSAVVPPPTPEQAEAAEHEHEHGSPNAGAAWGPKGRSRAFSARSRRPRGSSGASFARCDVVEGRLCRLRVGAKAMD